MIYVYAMIAAFLSATLRGAQNKNVIGNHRLLAFVTAILMYMVDAVTVYFVANTGLSVAPFSGIGAGCGYIASMRLHAFLMKHRLGGSERTHRSSL